MHAHHLAYLTPFLVVVLSAAAVHAEGLSAEGGRVRLSQVTHPEAPQPMMLHDRHHTALSRHPGPTLGRIRWSIELHGRIVGSGAVDHQGHSYWATAQGLGGQLHALDPDGILIRSIPLGGDTNSSPALGPDGEVYISTRNGDLIAFETDGRERWRHQTQLEILSSPLVDVPSGRVIFSARDRTIGLDLKTGKLAFEFDAQNSANNSSPTLGPDGLIRITNWGGFAAAIAGSGELVWKIPIGRSGFWASPTLGAFGTLYTASQNGDIIALSPNGRILWHTQAPGAVENFLGLSPDGHLVVPVSRHGIIALSPAGLVSWEMRTPRIRLSSTVAISADGIVYYSSADGPRGGPYLVGAARIGDPRPLWVVEIGEHAFSGPIIAPAVRGIPRLYSGTAKGQVYCIE